MVDNALVTDEWIDALLRLPSLEQQLAFLRSAHLLHAEGLSQLLDQAMRLGLTPLAWSPLGGGRLLAPVNARDKAVAAELDRIGAEQGVGRSG